MLLWLPLPARVTPLGSFCDESELWRLSVLYNTADGRLSSQLETISTAMAASSSVWQFEDEVRLHNPSLSFKLLFFHPKGCKRNQLDPPWALGDSSSLGLYFPSSFRGQFHQSIRVIISLPKIQRGTQTWMPGSSPVPPHTSSRPLLYSWSYTWYHPVCRFNHLLCLASTPWRWCWEGGALMMPAVLKPSQSLLQ